jgi:PTH1 family peptidyl-tRNA hydrolase
VTGHVLGNFSADDRQWLAPLLDALATAAPLLASGDDAGCMNKIALLLRPPKAEERPEPRRRPEPEPEARSPAGHDRSG